MTADGIPETLEELCDYIVHYATDIYIRAEVNGKWGSYALTEMPVHQAIAHALDFIKRQQVPIILVRREK